MATLIYKNSDQTIVAVATPPQSVDVELQNILNSELGGSIDDYGTVEAPAKADNEIWTVSEDGSATAIANPVITARIAAKTSANAKLRALGLTDEEIEAM